MTKKGVIPAIPEYVWIGRCNNCGSEYEATKEELHTESLGCGMRYCAVCELCEELAVFNKEELLNQQREDK